MGPEDKRGEQDFVRDMTNAKRWPHALADGLDARGRPDFASVRVWWLPSTTHPSVYAFVPRVGSKLDGHVDGLGARDSAVTRAREILSPNDCHYTNIAGQVAAFGVAFCMPHGGACGAPIREGKRLARCTLAPLPPVPSPTLAFIVMPPDGLHEDRKNDASHGSEAEESSPP
jgi:hypothetical protein